MPVFQSMTVTVEEGGVTDSVVYVQRPRTRHSKLCAGERVAERSGLDGVKVFAPEPCAITCL